MARFNKSSKSVKVTNLAGGKAYKQTDKFEFASILLTSFLKDQFYRSADQTADRLIELVKGIKDKLFVAKTAVYARTKFGMRSVSHLVAGEVAHEVKGEEWTKNFFEKVIHRPDDMLEITGYYGAKYGKPFPNSLKKGFAKTLEKMTSYNLSKYKGEGKEVSMVDLVNLVHPKSTDAIKELMTGKLKPADTWEVKQTQAGQQAETEEEKVELKANAWKDIINSGKIGYFALLRNLRNILEQVDDKATLDKAFEMLTDEKLIKKSLVLPFRFQTALDALEQANVNNASKAIKALNKAVDIACANVPKVDGTTLVVLDESGSMTSNMSGKGKTPAEIGTLFAAIMVKAWDADLMTFSESSRYRNVNSDDSTLTLAKSITFSSGGTNFNSIFDNARKKYDRIVILSDMQGWMEDSNPFSNMGGAPDKSFMAYKKKYGATPKVFSFDLQGYGTLQFPEENVFTMAGFSDKVFDVMKLLETDKNALISEIEGIIL